MTKSATPLVWVTRTPEGARRTARAIEAKGFATFVAPVLKIQPLRPIIDPHSFDALIITSRNGLNAFSALCSRRALTVWCVGESTADAAREKKFQRVISAGGNVHTLTDRIRGEADKRTRLLYAAPREPASAMSETLQAEGFRISEVAVYETQYVLPRFTPADLERMRYILVQSPKAGRAIAEALIAYHDKLCFPKITFICISEAAWQGVERGLRDSAAPEIREALEAGLNRRIAATPTEAAMLDVMTDVT
ncbi:hypothetical protein MMA231_00682 [Asticcacaulis sp. MM231]|uniref:uroporphyrinogen-III synthase n=1 Tax=Asticcacaulis sp. MM231 TaxID=3157666 RepID=UPI0032D57A4D